MSLLEEPEKAYNIRHRAFYFSKDVVRFVTDARYERIHFSLFDQLLRSATSIGANLVEGRAGTSLKDFLNFYAIALKSANETKYWLCLIRETLTFDNALLTPLIREADELSKIIASILLSSKRS